MKHIAYTAMVVVIMTVCFLAVSPQDARAQAFGMISATVEKTDDARGLTVRSEPSDTGAPVGYLTVGTEIKSCNDFKDGWVRLENPSKGNWVNMAFLKPKGGEGVVAAVDKPELCLAIRKGPLSSYEKIGCVELGEKLKLSGVWSSNNWARLEDGGWVDAAKIQTDLFVCSAPIPGAPEPEAQPIVQPPVALETEPPGVPVAAETSPAVSCYPACPAYGTVCPPIGVGCLPAPVVLGDFGAFGYFPGVYPFISIGVGPFGGWYGHRWHNGPYYGHYGDPGRRWRNYNRRQANIANTRTNNRITNTNTISRNARSNLNRSYTHSTNALRSNGAAANFSRGSYGSAYRGVSNSGLRTSNFSSRGRGMNVASFNRGFRSSGFRSSGFRSSGFRGASFRGGGSFHGMGFHGGGGGHRR